MSNIDFSTLSLKQLAAIVSEKLRDNDIDTTLVGGGCVSIYSQNRYQSYDLDYVTYEDMKKVEAVLKELNFTKQGRHFVHPQCPFFLEFISPPVAIGNEPIQNYAHYQTPLGTIKMLKATDSLKDRLASWYHWDDTQALKQAITLYNQVADQINLKEVEAWSKKEGHATKFHEFLQRVSPP